MTLKVKCKICCEKIGLVILNTLLVLILLAKLDPHDKVNASNFEILSLLGTGAYGRVYLVKKKDGVDKGQLYAMKVLEKVKVLQKKKTTEHTKTEREVSENSILVET